MIDVKIKFLNEDAKMPYKKHETDFCYDLYATTDAMPVYDEDGNLIERVIKYGTGISLEIDRENDEGLIEDALLCFDARPRSSIYKTGLSLCNSVGTIDEDYRGEVYLYFYNIIPELPNYKKGERIAQLTLNGSEKINFLTSDKLSETERNEGGFGHTGLR